MLTLWVAAGGAIGSVARYWLSLAGATLLGVGFPWATLLINVLGSMLIGYAGARPGLSPALRVFILIGICGGFTTFSSFSLQTFELFRDGRAVSGVCYVAASVLLCLASVAVGVKL